MIGLLQGWVNSHGYFVVQALEIFIKQPERFRALCKEVDASCESNFPFNSSDLWHVSSSFNDTNEEIPHPLCEFGLRNLEKQFLVKSYSGWDGEYFIVNRKWMEQVLAGEGVGGYAFGYRYFLQTHSKSIALIEVETPGGDPAIGTGVLLGESSEFYSLLTCKHVLFECCGSARKVISIEVGGRVVRVAQVLSFNSLDICAILIKKENQLRKLRISKAEILEGVITAGFPKISGVRKPHLVFHRGQVNGSIETYHSGCLLKMISAEVAPGNSGGPVFNEVGEVVGIVTERIEGRYEDGISNFGAMIPIEEIAGKDPSICGTLPLYWPRKKPSGEREV